MEKRIKELSRDIFNNYEQIGEKKIVTNLVDTIEEVLKCDLEDKVVENMKNSVDYNLLENEEDKEKYIEENKFNNFIDMINGKEYPKEIYNNVVNMFNKVGYDCYDGEFFPYEGQFISLNCGATAFIKREYDIKITTDDLFELVETEMNEGCHEDYIEDYETELDFYLSNVKQDSYISSYLSEQFDDLNTDDLINIANAVELEIKERI